MRLGRLSVFLMSVFVMLTCVNLEGVCAMIEDGKTVKFDYVLTVDGEVVDTSEGKQPLEYVQGEGRIVPGLEKEMNGLSEGDKKTVVVDPAGGYGARDENAVRAIPKENFPEDMELNVGQMMQMQTQDGQVFPGTILEVKDNEVVLDFNHPLAGKELNFEVTVVSVS